MVTQSVNTPYRPGPIARSMPIERARKQKKNIGLLDLQVFSRKGKTVKMLL